MDNEERTRYYGLRKGDTVKYGYFSGIVAEYGFMDNNRVYLQVEGQQELMEAVAEWCTIIKKVEDE